MLVAFLAIHSRLLRRELELLSRGGGYLCAVTALVISPLVSSGWVPLPDGNK